MKPHQLVKIYFSLIRSIADFACVVYHSLFNEKQSDAIEEVQLPAFKIRVSYRTVLNNMNFKTLKERRIKLLWKFAIKAAGNRRFLSTWFPLNHTVDYEMRARKIYKEFHPRTECMKRNPLYAMRKILNDE